MVAAVTLLLSAAMAGELPTNAGTSSKGMVASVNPLATDAGVAALSGTAFGAFGEGYLRFSVANSIENIEKALDRVGSWAKRNL